MFADIEQRFVDLDCNTADLLRPTPSACAHAFSLEAIDIPLEDAISENGAAEIYAAELDISLAQINRYSIILSKSDDAWQLSAFVGKPDNDFGRGAVFAHTFRSVHFDVPTARVGAFRETLKEQNLLGLETSRLAVNQTLENGEVVSVVCLDGVSLSAKQFSTDYVGSASRQGCRGRTKIDDFADALFDLAVEFDPELEPYRFTLPKNDP